MSIETIEYGGPVVLRCDHCTDSYLEFSSFKKAVAFKRKQKEVRDGWRTYTEDNGETFTDLCPLCFETWKATRR